MKVKEVIIVEGKKDTEKIKQAAAAETIETNGSAINQKTLELIQHAQKKRGVIIFTDPDYPGERIRHIIDKAIPGCKHAFLTKKSAESKFPGRSVGIEHASVKAIQEALEKVYEVNLYGETPQITKGDLITYGLLGGADSKARRKALGEALHIGYTNGKQLVSRLHMFKITKDELDQAMMHIIERGDLHE